MSLPGPRPIVSKPSGPTMGLAVIVSAKAVPVSVSAFKMDARLEGGSVRILMRFCHSFSCSEAVKPPMTAFSFMIRIVASAWTDSNI